MAAHSATSHGAFDSVTALGVRHHCRDAGAVRIFGRARQPGSRARCCCCHPQWHGLSRRANGAAALRVSVVGPARAALSAPPSASRIATQSASRQSRTALSDSSRPAALASSLLVHVRMSSAAPTPRASTRAMLAGCVRREQGRDGTANATLGRVTM
eukprot:3271475-Prymnesium_polylepis.1